MNSEQVERALRHVRDFNSVFAADDMPVEPHLLVATYSRQPIRSSLGVHICGERSRRVFRLVWESHRFVDFERYMERHCSS